MSRTRKISGLRRRWLINTVGVLFALGMVCVLAATALFATYDYHHLQQDLYHRAQSASEFIGSHLNLEYEDYYRTCAAYIRTFQGEADLEVQFIDKNGQLIVSSQEENSSQVDTPDIASALSSRGTDHFLGKETGTGRRIMTVSCPMIYSNGEMVGALRYVKSVQDVDRHVLLVGLIGFFGLVLILAVVWFSSGYCLRSVLTPVSEITEKARRIAGGTYGIQIETKYADEIGELADTINEMSAKISQNEKMQAEFISQLSHELRTPLTVINGWSETLLADDHMDPDTRQGMKIISGEAKRLTEMVLELLDFTRMQDGRMTLAVEKTDILAEFEDTVFMYGSRLSQDGIHLHYEETMEEIPEISCDPQRLRQVFLNILDNAAKHGGEGKRVDASIHSDEEHVIVRIRDYGPGIPEDEIPLVKKKFYKGSSSVRGTGIGLAVSDEIVELHGGSLTLENAEGGGTLVTVCLPVAQ